MTTVSVRELIRQKIAATVTQFGGGVLEPQNFDAAVQQGQPDGYQFACLVKVGVEQPPTPEGAREFPVEIWTFGPPDGSFTDVDEINALIINAINWQTFQEPVQVPSGARLDAPQIGTLWLCQYDGSGYADTRDPDLQNLVRPVRFRLASLRWRPDSTDNVLQALTRWASSTLYQFQTNPATWVPTDQAPLIYFRYAGVAQEAEWLTFDARYVKYPMAVHVISPTPDLRDLALNQAARALSQTEPDGLQGPAGDFVHLSVQRTDTRADPVTEGQIRIMVKALVTDSTAVVNEPPLTLVTLTSGDSPQDLAPVSVPPRWTATTPAVPAGGQEATAPSS